MRGLRNVPDETPPPFPAPSLFLPCAPTRPTRPPAGAHHTMREGGRRVGGAHCGCGRPSTAARGSTSCGPPRAYPPPRPRLPGASARASARASRAAAAAARSSAEECGPLLTLCSARVRRGCGEAPPLLWRTRCPHFQPLSVVSRAACTAAARDARLATAGASLPLTAGVARAAPGP